jgi:DNA-binding NarL/FixJ family response regulator
MIKVLIVDAHTIMRHGLRLILQEDPTIMVVGEAASGPEAIDQAIRLSPQIVLMDLQLPDQCGIQVIQQLRTALPETQILILTVTAQRDTMLAACQAGAKGYLLKSMSGQDVVKAIHQIAGGQAVLPAQLTTRLLQELATPSPTPHRLTDRERDVLHCMSQGLGNKEIASTLHISHNTVKTHVRRILGKLQLRNRTEAATFALQTDQFA